MFDKTTTWCGLALLSSVFTGLIVIPADQAAASSRSRETNSTRPVAMSVKGDRLVVRPAQSRSEAVAAPSDAAAPQLIAMLTRSGEIAYVSDLNEGFTRVAKNVIVPSVPDRPVVMARPAVSPSPVPIGCDRLVSVLVKSTARDVAARCPT